MTARKITALLVSASMLMGVATGCSKVKKVSQDKMDKAADKVEAETYDDIEDFQKDAADDIEDGVYLTLEGDDIIDAIEDTGFDEDELEEAIDQINDLLDTDIEFEIDDIQGASCYARMEDETNIAFVLYVDLGESNVGSEVFRVLDENVEDYQDALDDATDMLDIDLGDFEFDLNKLGGNEYYNGKNSGYLKLCITPDFIEDILTESLEDALDEADVDYDDDMFDEVEDVIDDLDFEVIAGGVYYNGGVIVVTGIVSDDEDFIADYESFMKTIGLDSPTKIKPSKYFKELCTNALVVTFGAMSMQSHIDYSAFDF